MNDPYVYFIYSEQQYQDRKNLEAKLCRTFVPGKVLVNGVKKKFTEMSIKNTSIYPDAKVVAEGYKSKMKYTPQTIISAKR